MTSKKMYVKHTYSNIIPDYENKEGWNYVHILYYVVSVFCVFKFVKFNSIIKVDWRV